MAKKINRVKLEKKLLAKHGPNLQAAAKIMAERMMSQKIKLDARESLIRASKRLQAIADQVRADDDQVLYFALYAVNEQIDKAYQILRQERTQHGTEKE